MWQWFPNGCTKPEVGNFPHALCAFQVIGFVSRGTSFCSIKTVLTFYVNVFDYILKCFADDYFDSFNRFMAIEDWIMHSEKVTHFQTLIFSKFCLKRDNQNHVSIDWSIEISCECQLVYRNISVSTIYLQVWKES